MNRKVYDKDGLGVRACQWSLPNILNFTFKKEPGTSLNNKSPINFSSNVELRNVCSPDKRHDLDY